VTIAGYFIRARDDEPSRLAYNAQLPQTENEQEDARQQREKQLDAGDGCQMIETDHGSDGCHGKTEATHDNADCGVGEYAAGVVAQMGAGTGCLAREGNHKRTAHTDAVAGAGQAQ